MTNTSALVPDSRFITFPGLFNLRDIGGYPVGAGGDAFVLRGRAYRSDALTELTPEQAEALTALGVRTAIDLRRTAELERTGRINSPAITYYNFQPGHVGLLWSDLDPAGGDVAAFLTARYLSMAENSAGEFAMALRVLAAAENLPVIMFCHAGRDRTGVLAMLLLGLLGVPDAVIAQDYALSAEAEIRYNQALRDQGRSAEIPPPHLVATPTQAALAFLRGLRERHGSIAGYCASAGFGPALQEALRGHFTEYRTGSAQAAGHRASAERQENV